MSHHRKRQHFSSRSRNPDEPGPLDRLWRTAAKQLNKDPITSLQSFTSPPESCDVDDPLVEIAHAMSDSDDNDSDHHSPRTVTVRLRGRIIQRYIPSTAQFGPDCVFGSVPALSPYLQLPSGRFIRLASPFHDFYFGEHTLFGRNVTAAGSIVVEAGASVHDDVFMGDRVRIGYGASVGHACRLGHCVDIGAQTRIGGGISNHCQLATYVGHYSIIGPSAQLGMSCYIEGQNFVGPHTVIGDETLVSQGTQLAALVHIGKQCQIGVFCAMLIGSRIQDNVVIGDECKIGIGALIETGCRIPDNTCIPAFSRVSMTRSKRGLSIQPLCVEEMEQVLSGISFISEMDPRAISTLDDRALDSLILMSTNGLKLGDPQRVPDPQSYDDLLASQDLPRC